jgi:regulator of protease activity HflC (stomatin/prohibitin superfamily)
MNFLKNRHDEQKKAEDHTREELEKYHVELVSVLICQIELPQDLMATQTARIIAEQQITMYGKEESAQNARITMESKKAEADKQPALIQSSIDLKIAENLKKKKVLDGEGEGGALKAKMEGEAQGTELLGKAKGVAAAAEGKGIAEGYEAQKTALTPEGIVAIEIAKQISIGNVKVTPDFLIQGGGDGASLSPLLSAFLVKQLTPEKKVEALKVETPVDELKK